MSAAKTLAEAFAPGEYIKDELSARHWTQEDLAQVLGRPVQAVNEIINDKKGITPETAVALGAAFGTSSEMWLNLQSQWLIHKTLGRGDAGEAPRRRSRLRDRLPVNDMVKRGWLPATRNVDELEAAACRFMGVSALNEDLPFEAAARRSGREPEWTPKQTAWLCHAYSRARAIEAAPFDREAATNAIPKLAHLSVNPDELPLIGDRLARLGIRLVVDPPLPGSKMDGAAFWLDQFSPVVALSVRYDRVDHFWFTLMHELAHIVLEHAKPGSTPTVDDEGTDPTSGEETEADRAAAAWTLAGLSDEDLPRKLSEITELAEQHKIHPGLIVGRLHHLYADTGHGVPYSTHRQTLTRVRHLLGELESESPQ